MTGQRKRAAADDDQPTSKRQAQRQDSPGKSVSFSRGLTQGRSGSGSTGASAGRSALRKDDDPKAFVEKLQKEVDDTRRTSLDLEVGAKRDGFLRGQVLKLLGQWRDQGTFGEDEYRRVAKTAEKDPGAALQYVERRLSDEITGVKSTPGQGGEASSPPAPRPGTVPPRERSPTPQGSPIQSAPSQPVQPLSYETSIATFTVNEPQKNGNDKDVVVCKNISDLIKEVDSFAKDFVAGPEPGDAFFGLLLDKKNAHLIRYIGCLALGGPKGEDSWRELVTQRATRHALVVGILGRALKEHVFADLCFGAEEEDKTLLEHLERGPDYERNDGFWRTVKRAEKVRDLEYNEESVDLACHTVTMQLEKMLAPFLDGESTSLSNTSYGNLLDIVKRAAVISRLMRASPDVVYYWPPTFKDEEYEPARMECLNLCQMIKNSPYEKKEIGGIERAVLKEERKARGEIEAIVKVVCFPGLVAYRKGGGAQAKRELDIEGKRSDNAPPDVLKDRQTRDRFNNPITSNNGFRSKTICKGLVYLQWGKQRLLTKEAGTSAHIDAVKNGNMKKYTDDYANFKELYNIATDRWAKETAA